MSFLIPPPPLRVSREQSALTKRFLTPALDSLYVLLLRLRQDVDALLAAEMAGRYAHPYPYGCCLEITNAMAQQLQALAQLVAYVRHWPAGTGGIVYCMACNL